MNTPRLHLLAGCMALAFFAVAASAAEEATFFPNLTKVYVPRGSVQLLKPYLPEIAGPTDNYQLVVETPRYLRFVAVEPTLGNPPARVRTEAGEMRDGVAYGRTVLEYDAYPSLGFELSICWQDANGKLIRYQPAISRGGTHDWQHVRATIKSPPNAAQAKPLIIKWQGRGISGTFWVDNVVFRRADRQENLLTAGTFDEPQWKSHFLKPEGKDGSRCAKFVCPPEIAERQQALWMDPELKPTPVEPAKDYVVELDLKAEKVGVAGAQHIAALLFRAEQNAPEGTSRMFTSVHASNGAASETRQTELIILPPLKNVRPKQARIAPCFYETTYGDPKVTAAIADNLWRSGMTWTYGSKRNGVVKLLASRGHRVWLNKPGHPFEARGKAREMLDQRPDLRAIGYDGKPVGGNIFCPTWLLSTEAATARRAMEDELMVVVERDRYTAVNWDIEQPVCSPGEGGKSMRGFCLCPRCLAEFRKQHGIAVDEKLDAQTIVARHKDAWVMFRCRQNAELVGHVRAALKRCRRPIEFSVYSGYQSAETRAQYGVDWALLAPHLDLAIAGYGGSRKVIEATREALGKVQFIGGHNYYLAPAPMRATDGWMRSNMAITPNPLGWRNRLLQQFVDGGCNGVLIWYLPTMDGGTFYYTSEAAEIIATYEDIFRKGRRCDEAFRVGGGKPEHWAAFEHRNQRLLLLMNPTSKDMIFDVEQPALQGQWKARLHGQPKAAQLNSARFTLPMEPYGTRVVLFSKR
ncbi:MAG: hypothetical protein HZC54_07435 [Verrucomicrobia bacterium]|nr:hypothetical protein [Verrucomicrobiota bacterium]